MSMHLEFEPHSWYMGAAIRKLSILEGLDHNNNAVTSTKWEGYYLNGNSGYIIEFESSTLSDLKSQIKNYINRQHERELENRRRIGEKV